MIYGVLEGMKMNQSNHTMPWAMMFRYAVVFLGIRPQDFWNMTMQEFSYLLGEDVQASNPISRQQLDDMIKEMKKSQD